MSFATSYDTTPGVSRAMPLALRGHADPRRTACHPNGAATGSRRQRGFTLMEMMVVCVLTVLLGMLLSAAWAGLGRPMADAVARSRVTQEATLALASLARDCAGSLPDPTGQQSLGRLVGRLVVGGSELWLCFDGGTPDGVAGWAAPDTVIIYEMQANRLVRQDQNSGNTVTVAGNLQSMDVADLVDGAQISLTFEYRDVTRTYTIVAKDP
jgi:type II secretory pathway component PulJ